MGWFHKCRFCHLATPTDHEGTPCLLPQLRDVNVLAITRQLCRTPFRRCFPPISDSSQPEVQWLAGCVYNAVQGGLHSLYLHCNRRSPAEVVGSCSCMLRGHASSVRPTKPTGTTHVLQRPAAHYNGFSFSHLPEHNRQTQRVPTAERRSPNCGTN
jgi:hypothetical protein